MINFALAREIYGLTPWLVDQQTLPALMGMFNSFQTGAKFEIPEIKYNTPSILEVNSDTRIIDRPFGNSWFPGQLDNKESFTGIGIINIDGVITTAGGASSMGMRDVSLIMQKMALDERIIAFILYSDSGGGASGAVEIMSDTISEIDKTKPVYGLIKKGGIAASAMYGILSACRFIYAESDMSIVGSAGTMMQFVGKPANSEDRDGFKYIRLYAPESTEKNKGFEEALNNNNYSILKDELLKPVNDNFLSMILKNRPSLEGTNFRDGHTSFAKDSIGTFIDGIKSFTEVVELATNEGLENISLEDKAKVPDLDNNNNLKSQKMNLEELKQKHLEVYNSVFNAGVTSERDRAGAWMAHLKTDPDAVVAGVKSGKEINATEREEFLIKGSSLSHMENLKKDSKKDVKTEEAKAKTELTDDQKELQAHEAEIDAKLNPKKS